MNSILKAVIAVLIINFFSCKAWGLTIVSPKEGQVVYQGDKLTVIVKPDPGEDWEEVHIETIPMSYNIITKEYKAEIEIPRNSETGVIDFEVAAYDEDGKEFLLKRFLFVKLPPNVILQKIVVYPDFIFLEKMPPESNPEDIKAFGTKKLRVEGIYSDGVKRKLTTGTTYTSNNNKIVTVSSEGEVIAQDIGSAQITVRNENYSVSVKIIIEPYGN